MKYKAIDELDNFQYHDAEVKEIVLTSENMIWSVFSINATTNNTQNNNSSDMCVEHATIIFDDIVIESIVFSAYMVHDFNNNLIKDVKAITAKPEEYNEILTESTDGYCYIFEMDSFEQKPDGTYAACFDIEGNMGHFNVTFSFSSSTVEWNNFSGKAWYEHPKWKKE